MESSTVTEARTASPDVKRLARLLVDQALSRRPKAPWLASALKHPVFQAALRTARTGTSTDKAFEPGSLTRKVILDIVEQAGIHVIARARPGTSERGAQLGKIDMRALRRLQKELGPIETAWVLFACRETQSPKVVRAATEAALAELCADDPELCNERVGTTESDPAAPAPQETGDSTLGDITDRLGKLEQQVRDLLDARKADTAKARDKDLVQLPSFASLRSQVEGHAKRLRSVETSLDTGIPKKIEHALKSLRTEISPKLKALEKSAKTADTRVQRVESTVREIIATTESNTRALADLRSRLSVHENAAIAPGTATGALVDELEQRLLAVERVIDDMRALFAPAAVPAPEPEAAPVDTIAATTPGRVLPARNASGDGTLEVERIRAARALRQEAAAVVGSIGTPDHFIVDGHNVVVEPLKSGSFESEREARSWLITQMVALADALDLPDVRIMFDTPEDTQYPERASDRVYVQFCGPDAGKADGRIVEVIREFRASDTVVVCSSDHKHVWNDVDALTAEGYCVQCVERFPVFKLMQAIERYLAAYEDFPVETRMLLVREELEEVAALVAATPSAEPVTAPAEGPTAYTKSTAHTRVLGAATTPNSSVIPPVHLEAWQKAIANHDFDAAAAELAEAERTGARHPYLTLARSITHLAHGDADAALEALTRFDYDPYAGPNMRVQVGLLRLLAHAQGIGRVVEPEDVIGVLAAQSVIDFDINRGSLGIYLASLTKASDVLRRSVEVIKATLGGATGHTAGAFSPSSHAAETDRDILRRAGSALAEGRAEDAARLYDLIEAQGVPRHHAYVNRAMVELARGHVNAAKDLIEQYAQLAATPMMRLQAVVLQQLARALEGDAVDPAEVALARERVEVFQAHLSPIWYLARCLRRGGASPEVESILTAAGF